MHELPMNLKTLRKKINVLQKNVANDLEIPLRTYQSYEYGEAEPSINNLIILSDYFNVSIDYLVGRTDNPSINK